MTVTIDELKSAYKNEAFTPFLRTVIGVLLSSINDWPSSNVTSLNDFYIEVKGFLRQEVTKTSIKKKLRYINYSANAWEAESLSVLLEIFSNEFQHLSLKEINAEIAATIKNNKIT